MPLTMTIECLPLALEYFDADGSLIERTEEMAYTLGDPISLNLPNADRDYDVRLIDGHTHYRHQPGMGESVSIRWHLGTTGTMEYTWDAVDGEIEYRLLKLVFEFYQDIDRPVIAEVSYDGHPPDRIWDDFSDDPGFRPMGTIHISPSPDAPWDPPRTSPA